MHDAPRELVADAPATDAAWLACLAPVTSRTLLAFAYEGTLTPPGEAAMAAATQQAVLKLLGIAGARVAVLTQRDAAGVLAVFTSASPLAPAFVVGAHDATPTPPVAEALAELVREGGFDQVLLLSADEAVLGHAYEVFCTAIRVGPPSPNGTHATYWIREQDAAIALCSRLFEVLVELAPAESVARP